MDQHRFETLTRSLTSVPSRREVLRGLAGAGLGLVATRLPAAAASKKGEKTDKKPNLNAFGCRSVGVECKNADQCCSGVCKGKRGKRRCFAHNSGPCTPQFDFCGPGLNVVCDPNDKEPHFCVVTTGKAAFCGDFSAPSPTNPCRACRRDRDCEGEFGSGAACVVMLGDCRAFCAATGGTACVPAAP